MNDQRNAAVTVRGLEVRVPSGERPYAEPLTVVRGLDLSVPAGQITAVVGADGAAVLRTLVAGIRARARRWMRELDSTTGAVAR